MGSLCCQEKRYSSVFSERGRLEACYHTTLGVQEGFRGTFGLALPVYRLGNGLNSTNFSWVEPTHTSDLNTGIPDKNGGRVSSKWSERRGKGSERSWESLASVASFMRQTLAGALACQAQRGVLQLQSGLPHPWARDKANNGSC